MPASLFPLHSDPAPRPASLLTALVYPQNKYPASVFEALVTACRGRGLSLAGVLQHVVDATPERRCEIVLEDLATGRHTPIFEDRGGGAAGCRLDEAALADVAVNIAKSLETSPDVLVLNKFGKAECEGEGLLDLIASAIDRNIAVVIGVPQGNLLAWRSFAGGLATELCADIGEVERWAQSLDRMVPAVASWPLLRASRSNLSPEPAAATGSGVPGGNLPSTKQPDVAIGLLIGR